MLPLDDSVITPICFVMDCESGLILSHAFSYGLARTDLLSLGMLALREKQARPSGSIHMFRSALGDPSLAKRKVMTDQAMLSLTGSRCKKIKTYNLYRAGALLGHFFYDWSNGFINELEDFRYVSPQLLVRLIENLVSQFNCLVESGDITFEFLGGNQSP
ncbi:hypothetical protein BSZ28_26345 [Pseudomonas moraviensis]|nr:hypothetical protein BSZ28_26345 [Pseudomonas moraviensis]